MKLLGQVLCGRGGGTLHLPIPGCTAPPGQPTNASKILFQCLYNKLQPWKDSPLPISLHSPYLTLPDVALLQSGTAGIPSACLKSCEGPEVGGDFMHQFCLFQQQDAWLPVTCSPPVGTAVLCPTGAASRPSQNAAAGAAFFISPITPTTALEVALATGKPLGEMKVWLLPYEALWCL